MTLFSLIWLAMVIWCFTRSDIKYMLFITLLFMTFQCDNVIEIGDMGIGPQILTSGIFVLKILISNEGKLYFPKKHRAALFAVYLLLSAILVSCIYNGVLFNKILNVGQIFAYILCFTFIYLSKNMMDSETLYQILRKIVVFLLVVGVLQILTTTGVLPIKPILKLLFYNDDASIVFFNRSYYGRIMSTFQEPSYFAGLLVGAFYYFLSLRDRWRENYILLTAIFVEMLLTISSTAYVAFAIVGVVFILMQDRINIQTKLAIIIIVLIGFGVLWFGFYDFLDQTIFSKTESGSYITRTQMNNTALSFYLESVWFGVGYKNTRGSSIFFSLLGETGRFGLVTYFYMNIVILLPLITSAFTKCKFNNEHMAILYAVMSIFVCQLVACPDVDLCTYWFWIYVLGVSLKESNLDNVYVAETESIYAP